MHGSIGNMGFMGIGGNDKRGSCGYSVMWQTLGCIGWGAYGRSSSDGAADLQFFDCFSDFCTIPFTFFIFPLVLYHYQGWI